MIPYGRQCIDKDDLEAVAETMQSGWLTTGPKVVEFEQAIAGYIGVDYAVSVSSGTAALHAAMFALGIKKGDEVIVPAITFAATANAVVYQGGIPVFADIEAESLLINPDCVEALITKKTRAIIGVDYGGQPCDWQRLKAIADKHRLSLVDDACHALGAKYKDKMIGSIADLTAFSFHPVKHITTAEGGMLTGNNKDLLELARCFRNHGINLDSNQRLQKVQYRYEITDLGFNYRLSDIQCALGLSQLKKLPGWLQRRRQIAQTYDKAFSQENLIVPLSGSDCIGHAYHLYVVKICNGDEGLRDQVFTYLRKNGIGVNVHYLPVYLHPFYQREFNHKEGLCPWAEQVYKQILSLPIYPALKDNEVDFVIEKLKVAINRS